MNYKDFNRTQKEALVMYNQLFTIRSIRKESNENTLQYVLDVHVNRLSDNELIQIKNYIKGRK